VQIRRGNPRLPHTLLALAHSLALLAHRLLLLLPHLGRVRVQPPCPPAALSCHVHPPNGLLPLLPLLPHCLHLRAQARALSGFARRCRVLGSAGRGVAGTL